MQKIDFQIDDFMLYCESKGLSKKTMASYEQTLKLFAIYLENEYEITDATKVKPEIVRKYIKYLQERGKYTIVSKEQNKRFNNPERRIDYGKKISVSTVNNYIRNIKVFYSYLFEERIIKTNPMTKIKQLKNNRKPQEFLSDEDFVRLLKSIDTTKFHEYRDYIVIQLIIDTGMRIGECLSITTDDIDLNQRCILLPAKNTKGKKDRYVFFSPKMGQELRRWLQYKDRYVNSYYLFCTKRGNNLAIGTFEVNFKNYGKRIRVEVNPHMLRNNFAKRFLMAGGDIYTLSRLLGHSSVTVTEKAYLDLTDDDIRQNYQRFSPLSNMRKARG